MQRARTPSQQQHPHAMATTLTMAVAAVGQQAVAASSGGGEDGAFCLQDLLQELLMALVGYPGDVFVDSSSDHDRLGGEILPPEACTLQLAPDLAWAGQGDREQLDELVRLGFHYQQLQAFIQQEQAAASPKSLYRLALCEGLTEVLAVYEDEVLLQQQQLLAQGADRGLPGLRYQLADLQALLPQLHQLAYELRRRHSLVSSADGGAATAPAFSGLLQAPPEARGAPLLAALHAHRLNGAPLLQACVQRLLWHVHQVLFNQLTMWMVHGLLTDEGDEFFIKPREQLGSSGAGGQQQEQQDDTAPAPDAGGHAAAAASSSTHLLHRTEDETYHDWHEAFEVALHQLPPGVTPHLATSVEFVGRAVRLLRAPPPAAALGRLAGGGCSPAGLLPHDDALAFASALRGLAAAPAFSQAALERAVEAIRADVASRLWQLLVVGAGLMGHLRALKDYFLLARGDFFQAFLEDAARLLAAPPRERSADADLRVPWQAAALKSTAQEDEYFQLFTLVLLPQHGAKQQQQQGAGGSSGGSSGSGGGPPKGLSVPAYDAAWDELRLQARLPWPLGVLLTARHLERYNAMFQLLLRLKRVQLALEQAWQELGRLCGRSGSPAATSDIGPLLQLRQHMGHLVANLQIYLQLDVVESSFEQLAQKVAAAQDFGEVAHAHERFVHALVTQSFLTHAALAKQLGEVFGLSRQLCGLVRGAREQGIDWAAVKEVHAAFDRTMSSLYVSLQSRTLQQYDKAPHLRQLYLRLDFNGYISSQRMRLYALHKTVQAQHKQQQHKEQQQQQQQQRLPGPAAPL